LLIQVLFTHCAQPNGDSEDLNTVGLTTPRTSVQIISTEQPLTQVPQTASPLRTPDATAEPSAPNLSPSDFFPLTIGSTWDYEGEGNEYASFNREVLYAQGDRAQVAEDNGGTVRAIVYQVSVDAVTMIYSMGEAYESGSLLTVEPTENVMILQAPLTVGATWEEPNGVREIVAVDAAVDTPAGKFTDCIQVKITYSDSTLNEYFKQGVGMVKREFQSGETVVTSTLKKYQIMD